MSADRVNAICRAEESAARSAADPAAEAERQQWERMYAQALALHVHELMASRSPRDLLAAAMLSMIGSGRDPSERSAGAADPAVAFAAAHRLGSGDRLVAWMEMLDCPGISGEPSCDPDAALLRLQRMEPGNAAVWIHALQAAHDQGDEMAVDRLLARAASAQKYEIPFGEIARMLFAALQGVNAPPLPDRLAREYGTDLGRAATLDDHAAIAAMGLAVAVAMPGHGTLSQICVGNDGRPLLAHRLSACISIYAHMAQDPLLISQRISLTSLARLTADSPAGPMWRERLRTLSWVWSEGSKQVTRRVPDGYLQSVWRNGEMVALEGVLRAAGLPGTPPPGWLPETGRDRALVTTGRLPPDPAR
ncbi:MAG: hypothetical protein M3Q40_03030 [Pseudomonadota bacterium]|nr:hypothetical protein [Pseudomonadota bacterium]